MKPKRVAVLGAGPIGLYAAYALAKRGKDVTLFERDRVGSHLLEWGETRLFTPFAQNLPADLRHLFPKIPDDSLLTGTEMASQVLQPLASSDLLLGKVREKTTVLRIGKSGLLKEDYPGHPLRQERKLSLLLEHDGQQSMEAFDSVLDATGTYQNPRHFGKGGLPAVGELGLPQGSVIQTLGALQRSQNELGNQHLLLIGSGYSAASAIIFLSELRERFPKTRISWVVRSAHQKPYRIALEEPLPERERVAKLANQLAADEGFVTLMRKTAVTQVTLHDNRFEVEFSQGASQSFHRILAFTGYSADFGLAQELQLQLSPVNGGPERLYRAFAEIKDCLSVPQVTDRDFATGEPNYFVLGAKSYGRSDVFLLQTGIAHLQQVLDLLFKGD